jgi:hypothetical protein
MARFLKNGAKGAKSAIADLRGTGARLKVGDQLSLVLPICIRGNSNKDYQSTEAACGKLEFMGP